MTPEVARSHLTGLKSSTSVGGTRVLETLKDAVATIADLQWEYGVEVRHDEDSEWQHTGPWWDTPEQARAWRGRATIRIGQPYPHDRLVRRSVGPVEVVDMEDSAP